MGRSLKEERLGQEKINNQGCLMKIIEYNECKDIVVEFQDQHRHRVHTSYKFFEKGQVYNSYYRLGLTYTTPDGETMKIVQYNNAQDIVVEFDDEYKGRVHTDFCRFQQGQVKNPYAPNVMGMGRVGNKVGVLNSEGKVSKEYNTWLRMLERSCDSKYKEKYPTYKDVTLYKPWLLYENFYEWLHSQENFEIWKKGYRTNIDKDILVKHNKIYAPDKCVLVPHYINTLFNRNEPTRGDLPIGVMMERGGVYRAVLSNRGKNIHLGCFSKLEDAFYCYKKHKENLIKKIAEEAFKKEEIAKNCYEAMMNYEVEITD